MAYTPVQRSSAQLLTAIDAILTSNNNFEITGQQVNELLQDLVVSVPNLISQPTFMTLAEYDPSRSYSSGMGCIRNSVIYQANASTTGAFDLTKWNALTGVTAITRAALVTLANAGTMRMGQQYYITDRAILGYAASGSDFVAQSIIKRVPIYFDGTSGHKVWNLWEAPPIGYALNERVVRKGLVYRVKNYPITSNANPESNTTDYQVEALNTSYYKNLILQIEYDLINDYIYTVKDSLGNYYNCPKKFADEHSITGQPAFDLFAWGNPFHYNNTIQGAISDSIEFAGVFANNTFLPGGYVRIIRGTLANQYFGNIHHDCILYDLVMNGEVVNCEFKSGAVFTSSGHDNATPFVGYIISQWNRFVYGIEVNLYDDNFPPFIIDKTAINGYNDIEVAFYPGYVEAFIGSDAAWDMSIYNYAGIFIINATGYTADTIRFIINLSERYKAKFVQNLIDPIVELGFEAPGYNIYHESTGILKPWESTLNGFIEFEYRNDGTQLAAFVTNLKIY